MSLNRDCTVLYSFPKSAGLKMYMGSFTSNLVESEPRTIPKFELSMGGPILKLNLTHNFPCFLMTSLLSGNKVHCSRWPAGTKDLCSDFVPAQ